MPNYLNSKNLSRRKSYREKNINRENKDTRKAPHKGGFFGSMLSAKKKPTDNIPNAIPEPKALIDNNMTFETLQRLYKSKGGIPLTLFNFTKEQWNIINALKEEHDKVNTNDVVERSEGTVNTFVRTAEGLTIPYPSTKF
jgi:hypothetical protein